MSETQKYADVICEQPHMKRPRQTLLVGLPRSLRGREPRGGDEQRGGRGDDAADAVQESAEVAEQSEPLHP